VFAAREPTVFTGAGEWPRARELVFVARARGTSPRAHPLVIRRARNRWSSSRANQMCWPRAQPLVIVARDPCSIARTALRSMPGPAAPARIGARRRPRRSLTSSWSLPASPRVFPDPRGDSRVAGFSRELAPEPEVSREFTGFPRFCAESRDLLPHWLPLPVPDKDRSIKEVHEIITKTTFAPPNKRMELTSR